MPVFVSSSAKPHIMNCCVCVYVWHFVFGLYCCLALIYIYLPASLPTGYEHNPCHIPFPWPKSTTATTACVSRGNGGENAQWDKRYTVFSVYTSNLTNTIHGIKHMKVPLDIAQVQMAVSVKKQQIMRDTKLFRSFFTVFFCVMVSICDTFLFIF